MHYDTLDTDWDDPNGWGKHTIPFLNTLHPITGNLVEYAIREHSCYQYPVVLEFIHKADCRIRKILESCDKHDPLEFKTQNYRKAEIARIISYVRNVTRIFRMYYQVSDEDKWQDLLPCFDDIFNGFNVGQLGEILNRVEQVLDEKLTKHCSSEVAQQDIQNLVTLMNLLERGDINSNKSPSIEHHPEKDKLS